MKLQTSVPLKKAKNQIDYNSRLLVLGSCFAEHIGDKLRYFKFQSTQNPFGILFHPKAIEKLVIKAIQKDLYRENELFFHNERWHCFDVHSDMSDVAKERLMEKLNIGLQETFQKLTESTHICISLGTAWVFGNKRSGKLVANCHKVPQQEFTKEVLEIEVLVQSLARIIDAIKIINPTVQFIFTVSPVRHLKDGFMENQLSKAHLISAVHKILQLSNKTESVSYFESYEIMMDELRDYRFYAEDMVHPNKVAIDYIWEKFKEAWISETSYPMMTQVAALQKDLKHRPFNTQSKEHQSFLEAVALKISYLKGQYPFMDFQGMGI